MTNNLKVGDIIDYKDGSRGIVVDTRDRSEIGWGCAVDGTDADVEKAYQEFYEDKRLAMIAAKAASVTSTNPFNMSFFDDEIELSRDFEDDPVECMRLAERFYRTDPVAGRVIELMAQFSIAGMRHQVNQPEIKAFFDAWVNHIGFTQILNRVFLNYYLYGNVYILKTLVNFKQKEVNKNIKFRVDDDVKATASLTSNDIADLEKKVASYQAKLDEYISTNNIDPIEMIDYKNELTDYFVELGARKNVWSKSMIPGAYTVLDPKSVVIYGPGDFGLSIMTYKVSDELKKMIEDPISAASGVQLQSKHVQYQKKLILSIPREIVSQIKAGANEVVLDPNYVSTIYRMKLDFQQQAFPLMTRAFKALHMKNRLHEVDNATINNMISQMVILKVGSDKHIARNDQLAALADAYKKAQNSKSLALIWNHTLEVEKIDIGTEILGSEKYKVWDDDIRDAFGISPLLIGRMEGVSGTAFMSVKGFMENLAQGREDVLHQFVYPEYHGIALAMGFEGYPEVVFDKFKLEDEASAINVLIKLVQTGILDYQTAAEELGYDWQQVLARHTEQTKLKDSGILRMVSPYNNASEDAPAPGTDSQTGGRPGGDGEKGGQPNSRPKSKDANPQKKVV